jgi:hypothetical protein
MVPARGVWPRKQQSLNLPSITIGGVRQRLLTFGDVALATSCAVFLWIGNEMKWDEGTTPVHPSSGQIPIWIALGCAALVIGRVFGRLRR